MMARLITMGVAIAFLAAGANGVAQEKEKKRTGSLTGEIKSSKASPNGKNTIVEVQASGEEKPRAYRVQYDPNAKGPIPAVLESVRAAKVGDRVQLDWIDTGEGLAITSFQVLKKSDKKDK